MIDDAAVAAAHPDLPGLALLLDPLRLEKTLHALGEEPHHLDRLRIKPGASVTAVLRPAAGRGPWLLARVLADDPWRTKRHKDLTVAARLGLPGHELPDQRLILTVAAGDRRLSGLARLHPDSGPTQIRWPVPRSAWPPGVDARGRTVHADVTTLSHNPARRWVGVVDLGTKRRVLRLHHALPAQDLPWQPGRPWVPGDPLPDLLRGQAGDDRAARRRVEPLARVEAAVRGLRMLHEPWGRRAAHVADRIRGPLGAVQRARAHGDLTPDQVVVDGDRVGVLDWDQSGLWPLGWDVATWTAGLIVAGWSPADETFTEPVTSSAGRSVDPAVLAAALILRGPEPFRRRHPQWADVTERLLAHAEQQLLVGAHR